MEVIKPYQMLKFTKDFWKQMLYNIILHEYEVHTSGPTHFV